MLELGELKDTKVLVDKASAIVAKYTATHKSSQMGTQESQMTEIRVIPNFVHQFRKS